jgi:hypothetical protein
LHNESKPRGTSSSLHDITMMPGMVKSLTHITINGGVSPVSMRSLHWEYMGNLST